MRTMVPEMRGYLSGWKQYFPLADTPQVFSRLNECTCARQGADALGDGHLSAGLEHQEPDARHQFRYCQCQVQLQQ